MRVLLLGTGAADGWPNPFCGCASCESSRAAGIVRAPTAALLDEVILIDCGPTALDAASRAGVRLDRVRHLLLTHAHPDHLAPLALLVRSWARPVGPLTIWGPAATVSVCRDWLGPDDQVTLIEVAAGARQLLPTELGDYALHAVAAAHEPPGADRTDAADPLAAGALLYAITGPAGERLLYATDTGPLPAATMAELTGSPVDLLLLEETFGDVTDHATGHLDLATFPRVIASLRAVGAIDTRTDVVAVHLGHHNPPPEELDRRLAPWGARSVPDLTELDVASVDRTASAHPDSLPAATSPGATPRGVRTLLLGGARSGKSSLAESRLLDRDDVVYVATSGSRDDDAEWLARVSAHRARRPARWRTVETGDIADVLRTHQGPVLVDCLTLWLTGRLDRAGAWNRDMTSPSTVMVGDTTSVDVTTTTATASATTTTTALAEVDVEIAELVQALRARRHDTILVSNEIGLGVVPATPAGRLFRDLLGRLNVAVAAECDEVLLVVAGHPVPLRSPATAPAGSGCAPDGVDSRTLDGGGDG